MTGGIFALTGSGMSWQKINERNTMIDTFFFITYLPLSASSANRVFHSLKLQDPAEQLQLVYHIYPNLCKKSSPDSPCDHGYTETNGPHNHQQNNHPDDRR